jgi:ATP-dependent DNA helicase RecG
MNLTLLKALVKKGESETLEFKQSTSSLSGAMRTVCAFLNSELGGKVLFGVTDRGVITGQEVTDKTLKELAVEFAKLEPSAREHIKIEHIKVNDKNQVIVLNVSSGKNAPYTYDARPYVRQQSTTTVMRKDEYIYLHNLNNPAQWESLTNDMKIDDLDHKRIREVIDIAVGDKKLPIAAKRESIPWILEKLRLIVDGKLTNAAKVLFAKNESKAFWQSYLQLGRFSGTTKIGSMHDIKEVRGNAFDLFDKAIDFLHWSLPVAAYIPQDSPKRVETPTIPYKVLREAVCNALIHRDYSHRGSSVQIAIYSDRVEISNFGALPKGISLKDLAKQHRSILRNPLIADTFFLSGNVEKWGRGTLDMIEECKQASNPLPIYEEQGDNFSVTFPLKEPLRTTISSYEPVDKDGMIPHLSKRQEKILRILSEGELSRTKLMKTMATRIAPRTMQAELAKLEEFGLIELVGEGRSAVWHVVNNRA